MPGRFEEHIHRRVTQSLGAILVAESSANRKFRYQILKLRSVALAAAELNKREGLTLQGHRTFTLVDFANKDVTPCLRELD